MKDDKCMKCDGCGKVADTEDQEPWSMWLDLPIRSGSAVMMGLVRPMPCPACGGTGRVEIREVSR